MSNNYENDRQMMQNLIENIKICNPSNPHNKIFLTKEIEKLIKSSVNLNFPVHKDDLMLISYVIKYHDKKLFDKCIKNGALLGVINGDGSTALIQAIQHNPEVMKELLQEDVETISPWQREEITAKCAVDYLSEFYPQLLLNIKPWLEGLEPNPQFQLDRTFINSAANSQHLLSLTNLLTLGANPKFEMYNTIAKSNNENILSSFRLLNNALIQACAYNPYSDKNLKFLSQFHDINKIIVTEEKRSMTSKSYQKNLTLLSFLCMNHKATEEDVKTLKELGLKDTPENSYCLHYACQYNPKLIGALFTHFNLDIEYKHPQEENLKTLYPGLFSILQAAQENRQLKEVQNNENFYPKRKL